jgi:hypothetical protein
MSGSKKGIDPINPEQGASNDTRSKSLDRQKFEVEQRKRRVTGVQDIGAKGDGARAREKNRGLAGDESAPGTAETEEEKG